jgi:hypothetical protein
MRGRTRDRVLLHTLSAERRMTADRTSLFRSTPDLNHDRTPASGSRSISRGDDVSSQPVTRNPQLTAYSVPTAWCLIIFPSTRYTTISQMFVAPSAIRSKYLPMKVRRMAGEIVRGSSSM